MRKKFEKFLFPVCVAILIAISTLCASCTHFALRVGELKDAEVTLDNTSKE